MNFSKKIVLSWILLYSALASSATLYYPGSFDPFHKTHLAELKAAQELVGLTTKIVILPIESAYYNSVRPGVFDYETRLNLITAAVKDDERISVADDLKSIQKNALETIDKVLSSSKLYDSQSAILIGTDVLDLWRKLPEFSAFIEKHNLIVGKDARNLNLYKKLQQEFKFNPRIIFSDFVSPGIRSADVNLKIIEDSESLSESLPAAEVDYIKTHHSEIRKNINQYLNHRRDFEKIQIVDDVLKALSVSGFQKNLLQDFKTCDKCRDILLDYLHQNDRDILNQLADASVVLKKNKSADDLIRDLDTKINEIVDQKKLEHQREFDFSLQIQKSFNVREEKRGAANKPDEKIQIEGDKVFLVTPSASSSKTYLGRLDKIKSQTTMYHWNSTQNSSVWWQQGKVDADDFYWRLANRRSENRVGGGVYVSLSPSDSASFGQVLTKFKSQKDLVVLVLENTDFKNNSAQMSRGLRNVGISAVAVPGMKTWFNLIDPKINITAERATILDLPPKILDKEITRYLPLEYWLKIEEQSPKMWARSFDSLSQYPYFSELLVQRANETPFDAKYLFERNEKRSRLIKDLVDNYGLKIPRLKMSCEFLF